MLPRAIPVETASGRYLLFASKDMINTSLVRDGVWDPVLVEVAHRILGAGEPGTVVDVGANLGAVTIALARRLPSAFTFHCFEIQRIVFYQLCGNIVLNRLENVHAHPFGLGAAETTIALPLPDYATDRNIGALSASAEVRRERQGAATDAAGRATETAGIRTLDSFGLTDVRLIKIDVEGMELEVLEGARETLARNAYPPLLLEVAKEGYAPEMIARSAAVLAHVAALGYGCQVLGTFCVAQHHSRRALKIKLQDTPRPAGAASPA